MSKNKILYEGKAKQLFTTKNENELIQFFKDDATAFNKKNMSVIDYTNNSKKAIINSQTKALQNIWKIFLLGALICFILELLVLKFWRQ